MYQLKLAENVRRYIGDMLLAHNGKTASVSSISSATGISRMTLTKWFDDPRRLYCLTKHIGDEELRERAKNPYLPHDSKLFDRAVVYCRHVIEIRSEAESGSYGEDWQREELDRRRDGAAHHAG